MDSGLDLDAGEGKHRREDVDEADLRIDAHALQSVDRSRHDEGHVLRIVVDVVAMRPLTVTSQRLAMIADDDDDGALVDARAPQPGEEPIHLLIDERDLAVVRSGRTSTAELGHQRLRRLIRSVRVVEMDPGEERPGLAFVQPTERGIEDLIGGPLNRREVQLLDLAHIELVVVRAEALIESPAAVENESPNERPRLIAVVR